MDENDKELIKLIASGGVSGGLIGGVGSLLGGAPTLRAAGKAAAIGSALSGGLAGLSGAIGLKALGSPSEEDGSGYTKRLGAGGAIAGGLSGAALGSLMAIPSVRNVVASKLGGGLISRGIKNMKGVAAPMASVGAGGAAIGAYQGSDEGMQMDFIRNLSREQKEKILRRQMMEGA